MTKDITVEQVELKPCPFCGGQPSTQDYRSGSDESGEVYGYAAVECQHGASGGVFFHCDTLEEAITALNTRHTSTLQAQEQIKVLREALERIADGDYPMPHHDIYRSDSVHSKHDRCPHGRWMYEGCDECCADYARQALEATNG